MIDKEKLLDYLRKIDSILKEKIILIAVGGTAMTLLNLKATTRDIDFCLEGKDYDLFKKAISRTKKFKIDLFQDGYIFSQHLPEDYIEKSIKFKEKSFEKIDLRIIHPVDIILTKISRLNARDEDDIDVLIKTKKIDKEILTKRFKEIIQSHVFEKEYRYHFNLILNRYFK